MEKAKRPVYTSGARGSSPPKQLQQARLRTASRWMKLSRGASKAPLAGAWSPYLRAAKTRFARGCRKFPITTQTCRFYPRDGGGAGGTGSLQRREPRQRAVEPRRRFIYSGLFPSRPALHGFPQRCRRPKKRTTTRVSLIGSSFPDEVRFWSQQADGRLSGGSPVNLTRITLSLPPERGWSSAGFKTVCEYRRDDTI